MKYFGPERFKKPDEELVPVPIGETCHHCGEGFLEGDMGEIDLGGNAFHHECTIRLVAGSLGHQRKKCSCYGGTEEDPEGLSKREAAKEAAAYFYVKNEPQLFSPRKED